MRFVHGTKTLIVGSSIALAGVVAGGRHRVHRAIDRGDRRDVLGPHLLDGESHKAVYPYLV